MKHDEIIYSLDRLQKLLDDGNDYSFWSSVPRNSVEYIKIIKEENDRLKEENIKVKNSNNDFSSLILENDLLKNRINSLRNDLENCEEDKRVLAKILLKLKDDGK